MTEQYKFYYFNQLYST